MVERRQRATLWGKAYFITPRLVTRFLGDGKQLIWFTPMATRPNYYAVRIDSSWKISNWEEPPNLIDHVDEIYSAIEEEYGNQDDEGNENASFPVLCDDCGSSWVELDLEELKKGHLIAQRKRAARIKGA